jgi:hypothetical protein
MRYLEEMQSKWGFSDGDATPAGIYEYRTAYILAVNTIAAQLGSKQRMAAFDRPGMHNGCLVFFTSQPEIVALPIEALTESRPGWVGEKEEATDELMSEAIRQAWDLDIDGYVTVRVSLSKGSMNQLLKLKPEAVTA